MATEETELKHHSRSKVIYRFLGGAALGAFVVSIPISYGVSTDFSLLQFGLISLLILSSGLLSSIWGGKFIDAVMQVLNSFAS